MRRLILQEFVTIDGFAADRKGTTSFFEVLPGDNGKEIDHDLLKFIHTIDTILLGANTYKMFLDYWPSATTDTELVADALNATPKVIFSSSLDHVEWGKWNNAVLNKGNAADEVRKLKSKPGKDIVLWGSISLAQSLLKEGLIDEIQLRVCPVALGDGMKLFSENLSVVNFELTDVKHYKAGVIHSTYKPAKQHQPKNEKAPA